MSKISALLSSRLNGRDEVMFMRMKVRQLKNSGRGDDAVASVLQFFKDKPETADNLALKADLLNDCGRFDDCDQILNGVLTSHPDRTDIRINFVNIAFHRGQLGTAYDIARPIADTSDADAKVKNVVSLYQAFTRFVGRPPEIGQDNRPDVITAAFRFFKNRDLRPFKDRKNAHLAMLASHLGPGGAERQFSLCSIELYRKAASVGGVHVATIQPMTTGNDFYLHLFEKADVPITELAKHPRDASFGAKVLGPDYQTLQSFMQQTFRDGMQRIGPWVHDIQPDCLSIWQDHMFFTALAGLVEGVPAIHLNIRGASPEARGHDAAPKYKEVYQVIADVPGIYFHTNSSAAAQSYSDWLGLPLDRFEVIPNGAVVPSFTPTQDEQAKWTEFEANTKDADVTIGTVSRFDPVKRLSLWLDAAAAYGKRHPKARFIIVGSGQLETTLRAQAENLGLIDRLLFTGLSDNVGFWLRKMDAFLFVSETEGMPNVVVEAQFAGRPVVSTLVGEAGKCFIDGTTGRAISDAQSPSIPEICDHLDEVISDFRQDPTLSSVAEKHVGQFSVSNMGNRYFDSLFRRIP